jgi:hypothetical protein
MSEATLSAAFEPVRQQIVITPHHTDRLRRPPARPDAIENERFRQTLLWNIFRTFELLPPAFWIRRLQARLHVDWFPAARERAEVLTHIERALARNVVEWLERVGIS